MARSTSMYFALRGRLKAVQIGCPADLSNPRDSRGFSKSHRQTKTKKPREGAFSFLLAEGVGFEPTRLVRACRFSRPVQSTTLPPFHARTRAPGGTARGRAS